MKFQVVICITFSLLGVALSGPMEIGIQGVDLKYYDGMTQQDSEADDYKGQIQQNVDDDGQDSEPGDYDVILQGLDEMIQQDSDLGDYDGMIQQDTDYDGMIQQDSEPEEYDGMLQQDSEPEDYDGMIQQDSEPEDYDGMLQQDSEPEDYDGMLQQDSEPEDYDGMIQQGSEPEDYDGMIQQDVAMESQDEAQAQFSGPYLSKIRQRINRLRQRYLRLRQRYLIVLRRIRARYNYYLNAFRRTRARSYLYAFLRTRARYHHYLNALRRIHYIYLLRIHRVGTIPLYRYWKAAGRASDHFYTNNPREIGTIRPGKVGRHGYRSEGVACRTFAVRFRGSVPLYRYYGGSNDHFYTTNANEIGTTTPGRTGKHGYRSEGIVGYCFPSRRLKTVPLYRYWNPRISDHFYTRNIHEIGTAVPGRRGKHGYISEGVACYVYP